MIIATMDIPNKAPVGSLWKDSEGNIFEIIFYANMNILIQSEYPMTIIFKDMANRIWAKEARNWFSIFKRIED